MEQNSKFLSGRRVLVISPCFFGYEKQIVEAVKEAGGECLHIDERPGTDSLTKALVRVNASLIKQRILKYYKKHLKALTTLTAFDFILVISPEAFNEGILDMFKTAYPKATFILYMWDSIRNKSGGSAGKLISLFDRALSFDKTDCKSFPDLIFRPLFYSKAFEEIADMDAGVEYSLSFVGTAHSDRYELCRKVSEYEKFSQRKMFKYLYLSDRRLFWLQKMFSKTMRGAVLSDFSFTPMAKKDLLDVIARSIAVFDIQHPNQIGLTMRSIEVLGAKRKLVTTNRSIETYDFYNVNNICIVDREDPVVPEWFLKTPYREIDESIYARYSISGWLKEVLVPLETKGLVQ